MEPLPASQDALRLELRLAAAAGARNDADANGGGLPLLCLVLSLHGSLSCSLIGVDQGRWSISFFVSIVSFVLFPFPFPFSLCSLATSVLLFPPPPPPPPPPFSPPFSSPFARLDKAVSATSRGFHARDRCGENVLREVPFLRRSPRGSVFRGNLRSSPKIESPDRYRPPITHHTFGNDAVQKHSRDQRRQSFVDFSRAIYGAFFFGIVSERSMFESIATTRFFFKRKNIVAQRMRISTTRFAKEREDASY